ncbi:hypothetical protein Airi02_047430 [Actinoallomurus iriomotensis]|uniref:Uncharacterized protein n=1 Tax=Actinoallomurus iriomotensis TaxID=478107 RepID=A0A9W6W0X4_9ACTN|nr:hypothetical protein Airi02_047430 [Actinoallomurus iriomotensis]
MNFPFPTRVMTLVFPSTAPDPPPPVGVLAALAPVAGARVNATTVAAATSASRAVRVSGPDVR